MRKSREFRMGVDGFYLDPRLPSDWPELTIGGIRWHDRVLTIRATKDSVEIREEGKKPVVLKTPCVVKSGI